LIVVLLHKEISIIINYEQPSLATLRFSRQFPLLRVRGRIYGIPGYIHINSAWI